MTTSKLKVFIAYPEITGYALACWDALAARKDIELRVFAGRAGSTDKNNDFRPEERSWLTLHEMDGPENRARAYAAAVSFAPQVAFISGWSTPAFTDLVFQKERIGCRVVVCLDTSLHRPMRQLLGRVRLSPFLGMVDAFLVPGERGREFLSRWWRIPDWKIRTGLYGVDLPLWHAAHAHRKSLTTWPRSFLFAGRYLPSKGVRELLSGYRSYRASVQNAMELRFCGRGPLGTEISQEPGTAELGFVQPAALGEVFRQSGCFVLPSHYDPWAVALVEACAAGLPIIASVGCGATVEILRDGLNGTLLREVSSEAIASALRNLHERYDEWPAMGRQSAAMAAPYAPTHWAKQVATMAHELTDGVPYSSLEGGRA